MLRMPGCWRCVGCSGCQDALRCSRCSGPGDKEDHEMLRMLWTPDTQLVPPSCACPPTELCPLGQQGSAELLRARALLLQREAARRGRAALRQAGGCCQPRSPMERKMPHAGVWEAARRCPSPCRGASGAQGCVCVCLQVPGSLLPAALVCTEKDAEMLIRRRWGWKGGEEEMK